MLVIKGLRKSFAKTVLDGATFSIPAGEVYGLLGTNGAGKTTTINIICNFIKADAGTIIIDEKPFSEDSKYLIGMAPQEISIYKNLTCRENLEFFASIYGIYGTAKKQRVEEMIEKLQLSTYAHHQASSLSGGWQRRMNIAVALVHSPRLLILDEPTTGLDVEARYKVWELIEKLAEGGVTILLTSHYFQEIERLCKRIGILHQGRIVVEGTLDELRSKIPAERLVFVESNDEHSVCERAGEFGWKKRYYYKKLAFWLPHNMELKDIVNHFEGISLTSVSLQQVSLEHVYLDLLAGNLQGADNG